MVPTEMDIKCVIEVGTVQDHRVISHRKWGGRKLVCCMEYQDDYNMHQVHYTVTQQFLSPQVLNKDLESKEKQTAKIITQHQEMAEKFEESDRQRCQTLAELESTLKKLREVTREAEALKVELKETQQVLQESENRREEIKARAQDTVRQ